jgi:HK97 family phage portal protein
VSDVLARIQERARGKSMADLHPEVLERQHIGSFQSGVVSGSSSFSYLSALGNYESHVWVRKAITVIANNVSPLPLQVRRGDEVIENHDLAKLLTDVNDTMSSADMWQQWCIDMLLGGEEGWELVKNARGTYLEIWPRQPHIISVVPDQAKLRYYGVAEYKIDDGIQNSSGKTGYTLPTEEFVHFKFYNPRNPWRGISPISAIRNSILIDMYAQAWSKLFFQKSARPDYAVIAPQGITKTERDDLEKALMGKFGGFENSHKPVVLEQGVTDIKPLDMRPKDLEWLGQRELARDEIGAIFGVPDEIMGWGRDTYENFETAHWVLWSLTLLPMAMFRDTHLTEYFRRVKALAPDESIVTDTSQVAALKKDLKNKVEMLDVLARWGYPINVASAYLGLGLPIIDGGDVGYLPLSLVPVTSAGKQISGAAGKSKTVRAKTVAYDSEEHHKLFDLFVKRTTPWEKKLGDVVADVFREQQREVLTRLSASGKGFAGAIIKDNPREIADDPFDRDDWDAEFAKRVKPTLREIIQDAGTNALADISIEMDFDVDEPRVVRFLRARAQRFAKRVNETTWNDLKQSLSAGIDAGENISDLEKRVESVMGNRIRSSGETIARTEVIGAANGGTLEAWKQSEVVEEKVWLAALDDRTRDSHVDAHGQTVKLEDNFEVGDGSGPAPGQIGIAEEDINCRCSMQAKLRTR